MIRFIDQLSEWTGKFAAWMFFVVGLIITYEVFMRYIFIAPTIWVDETARIMQIWAAYLAGGFALKHREMIVIDVAFRNPDTMPRRLVETFSLLVIVVFCAVAAWYGYELWLKATLKGHTTDSYLGTPKWLTHASIWVGFGLLLLQAVAEIVKVWTIGIPHRDIVEGVH
jgi:TRAP-type mannitol/chloroaromatic compound transport system permease small subunit